MAIYTTIMGGALRLFLLAIDVTAFFVLISTVTLGKRISWLLPFHQAGGALVRGYTEWVDRWWARCHLRPLSIRGKHIIGLLILETLRLILVGAMGLL